MAIVSSGSRAQIQLIHWEQFVASDNPVRVIDAFVDLLDLEQLGFTIKGKSREGRPAFSSDTLLKLYFYGYLNRCRSSRQLMRAARQNVELFWLLQEAKPCYKTIADFRKNNTEALKKTFSALNRFLRGEGLFQSDTIAVDGTKIAAQNSKKNNYNQKKIQQHLDYINKQTAAYLAEMDSLDSSEQLEEEPIVEIAQKLDDLHQRKEKYEDLQKQLDSVRDNHQAQISTTDPDARALPKKMNIVEMSYNVQTAVEAKTKLITNFEVTNENDTYGLSSVAIEAKAVLKKEQIKALADKGYDTGVELKICAENNIETYVAPRQKNTSKKHPDFVKKQFRYDPESDHYTCPAGKELRSNGSKYKKNSKDHRKVYTVKVYKLPFEVCNSCVHRLDCAGQANLNNSKGRPIERSEYDEYLEANRERVRLNKALYRTRQQIVEHPFGTIKRGWGFHYTLLKTKEKVAAEMALIFACYNLRRSMSIFGLSDLLRRLKAAGPSFFALTGSYLSPLRCFLFFKSQNRQASFSETSASIGFVWAL